MNARPWTLVGLIVVTLIGHRCAKQEWSSEPATTPSEPSANSASEKVAKEQQGERGLFSRKIIRDGELKLWVKTYQPARRAIEDLLRRVGGYLSHTQADHQLGQVSSATLVLRIPADKFAQVLDRLSRLGTVIHEATSSRDITEEYYDLRARLDNAKKLESRLLELMAKQTGKVSDLLQVERELARVREQVEKLEGKLRLFDHLVALSTLTVHLEVQEKYVPPRPPSLAEDLKAALGSSWDELKAFGRLLLLFIVVLIPWLAPLAGLCALGWLALRWWRRRARREGAKTDRSSK